MYRRLKHFIDGKIEGRIEVMGRRGRRYRELLDYFKERRGYCKWKEEAPDRSLWRTHFWKILGPNVRQTAWWMKPIYPRENILLELDSEGEASSVYCMSNLNNIFLYIYLVICILIFMCTCYALFEIVIVTNQFV